MTEAYPLQWPAGRQRTPAGKRRKAAFSRKVMTDYGNGVRLPSGERLTIADALKRLQASLARVGARLPVISTNLDVRLDGLPRSGQREPGDPGVAIYFQLAGKPHCMPCDTYNRVADNLAAVSAHIEATRAIERHGVATLSEMFAGFQALPSPDDKRPWRQVFGLHREPVVTLTMVEERYRDLARERHPDAGGNHAMMAELNVARAAAKAELRA